MRKENFIAEVANRESCKVGVANRIRRCLYSVNFWAVALTVIMATFCFMCPSFAAEYTEQVKEVINKMVDVVGTIFQAVGVVLGVYSVGTLLLAFKNEDPDSKSRASTLLVVAVAMIAFPSIIRSLGLVDLIGTN